MAKKTGTTTYVSNTPNLSKVKKYVKEFEKWRTDLKPYWNQMDKNEELYEFYKSEYTETNSNVSLNTPFAIVESQIAKENKASLMVTVQAEGQFLEPFEDWIEATVKGIIQDKRVESVKGTFRKKRERWSRSLKVVGNAVAEVAYCYATQVVDGKKVIIADNPYVINRHYKSVIFNPTRQFDSSNKYYIEDWMRIEDMEAQEYKEITNENGKVTKVGKFQNLEVLRSELKKKEESNPSSDDNEVRFISGDRKISRKNEPIHIITCWELEPAGWTRCVYAADRVMIMPKEVDPLKIGRHPLLIGMRYVVEGRPYAYGEMDPIYKPVRAQDTIVNQKIEIINRYLRGSYVAGNDIDIDTLAMILDQGGIMQGNAEAIKAVPVNVPPTAAFQEVGELQQAIERAARYSPYSAGTPNASTDSTAGTKGGILALQNAAEPNTDTQIDDVEDMFLEPFANIGLKMVGNYMAADDIRYSLLQGKNKEWVKAVKGILLGKPTIPDLVLAGFVTEEQAQEYLTTIDPVTQQPIPIPGADKAYVFDVNWIIDISLDNQSHNEKMHKIALDQQLIQFGLTMGAQFDPERTVKYLADKQDAEEVKELLLNPEEKQARQQQMMQMAQAQNQQDQKSPQQPKAPSESLNYKDAPPDIQRQIEAQAGLQPSQLHPQVAKTLNQPIPEPQMAPAQGAPQPAGV